MEEEDYPNYKLSKKKDFKNLNDEPFKVDSVDGFAMLLNLSRLNKLENFSKKNILMRIFSYI